jgi:gamma-polyglutamate synthase
MSAIGLIAGGMSSLIVAGALEKFAVHRARTAIPIRIHVNGTRGKSTVTRLIHSALCEAGIPALGKTTGTAARLLLPDRTEQPIPRRGRPNIREQMWLLRLARKLRVRAIIVECMAVHPALQWTTEREMLLATIGVITNVRTDHAEVMGNTPAEIALSLANTIPRGGMLILGETTFAPLFRWEANKLDAQVLEAADPTQYAQDGTFATALQNAASCDAETGWMQQSWSTALAVTRHLGIPDPTAFVGMQKAIPDPGATRCGSVQIGGRLIPFVDARAANDPESFHQLLKDYSRHIGHLHATVYNHRADRPERLRCFLKDPVFMQIAEPLLVTGDRPCFTLWREVKRTAGTTAPSYIPTNRLCRHLGKLMPAPAGIVFCGNARGLDPQLLDKEAARG